MTVILQSTIANPTFRGKVRDIYDLGDGRLLMVATDRISAFDFILPNGIPDKGPVLTQMSKFWFEMTKEVVPNHYLRLADGSDADGLPFALPAELRGRSMIVKEADRLGVECIVRGYLTGSAWAEYRETGHVCGLRLPAGLVESQELPGPLFTPAAKADGGHDMNMPYSDLVQMVGPEIANTLRIRSLALYTYASGYARDRGIIIADTKFEFGTVDGEPILIDEILTPDSSRFWPANRFEPGHSQPCLDKQFVRDWLLQSGWDRESPPPALPDDIVEETADRYREAFTHITGNELQRF
jgi:phosphoribosylaminoimidazole-succinocarboxamide synthase